MPLDNMSLLPQTAQSLSQIIGIQAVIRLCETWPGIPIRIPVACDDEHALCIAIGKDAARALCDAYGGETITPPKLTARTLALRDAEIREARRAGESGEAIAKKYNLSIRQVWRIAGGILPVRDNSSEADS